MGVLGEVRPDGSDTALRTAVAVPLRAATAVSVAAVVVVLGVQVLVPEVWQRWPWLPFAVGLLAGLPHGALDHLVPWWSGAAARSASRLAGVLVGYLALAATTFAVARVWPVPALVVLLLASVVHFGTGEAVVADERAGAPAPRWTRWPVAGLVPVGLPLVIWPDTVRPVLDALAPGSAAALLRPPVLAALATVTLAAGALALGVLLRRRRYGEAAEVLLLAALFVVVPPLPAFGVYFGAWHGLRHLARLLSTDPGNVADLAAGRLARPVRRLAVAAAPPTAAVLVALGVLLAVPGAASGVLARVVPVGLAVVLALTVPHMIVVGVLDRRRRVPTGPFPVRGTDAGPGAAVPPVPRAIGRQYRS